MSGTTGEQPREDGGESLRERAVRALDVVLLVRSREDERRFSLVDPVPDWWGPVFGSVEEFRERSPFLDDFIDHAAGDFWRTGLGGDTLRSGIWEEASGEGERRFFEAIASRGTNDEAEAILLVQPADERWREEQAFVQNAHDQSLSRRRLLKELEKKQVLLECIMHDLGNPLATVLMNLQHLERQLDDSHVAFRPALRRAVSQAERQRALIRSIGEVFAADLAGSRESLEGGVPNLVEVAAETLAACAPAAAKSGVTLCPFFGPPLPVAGERLALSRVLENLLVNAIRHSPRGGRVNIAFEARDGFGICRVEDEGEGIEPGLEHSLFRPFVQGTETRGSSGLGLYFCRLTVEMWGGTIEAGNREDGGAVFVFRLPLSGPESGKEVRR